VVGASAGAALDVHIVTEHWNASKVDVMVGYSAHLHALTNVPIRIKRWRAVTWISRLVAAVLIIQAATLTSQIGSDDTQVFGSAIWLLAYVAMLIPPRLLASWHPDALLRALPASVGQLEAIVFSSRRAALAFVDTLLMTEPKARRWDWMNGFIPAGDRRKSWEDEMMTGKLGDYKDDATGLTISEASRKILREVQTARDRPDFIEATARFRVAVGLPERSVPIY
jgi:hypothetical protein